MPKTTKFKLPIWTHCDRRVDVDVELGEPTRKNNRNAYPVVVDGLTIGSVERFYAIFERKTRGKRYVNRRWLSLRWAGICSFGGVPKSFYGLPCDTRKEAARLVVEEYIRRKS